MFTTVGIYIVAIFSVLSGHLLIFATVFTILLIIALCLQLFPIKYILIWTSIFYLGVTNTSFRIKDTNLLLNIAPTNSTIYGKIISIPQIKNENKLKFFFEVNSVKYGDITQQIDKEKVFVTLNTNEKLKIYDSYKITGRLSVPFKAGNPSQFDYGNYLRNFDTYSVFYDKVGVKSFEKINGEKTSLEHKLQKINDLREKIIQKHSQYLKTPNLEILGGIVFGDDAVSPPENIKSSFINSGLLHILAASGMNVAFIFSFFFFFMSCFRINYKVNVSICILMVIIYSLMTGLGASVIRATFMLIFVLVGKLIDRDAHNIALLAFVAFLMLLYNPMYINDVGFQLSFVVTFGLLLMTPFLIHTKNRIMNWIIGSISVPVIAQLWVIPIQIFYFNNISIYSVFANIMSIPILSIISFGGFISSLLALVTPDIVCQTFDFILNPLISILINISDFWGNLKNATMQTTHPSILQILLYYGVLINLMAFLNKEIREKYLKYLIKALIILVVVLSCSFIPAKSHDLEITTFDVGNADSFLIKTPENKYLMIDTAKNGYNGGKSQAELLILKYLKDRGIKKIDTIVITHFDNDHCGGAVDLINGVTVNKIYVNSLTHNSNAAKEIYKTAKNHKTEIILAKNNQQILNENGLILTNYISKETLESDDNESSILTLLKYGNFNMLFTGDAGVNAFLKINQFIPKDITVLKVGHHGASGVVNKQMLEYLKPKYALISTGENKFGHPSILTVSMLSSSKILRTDNHNSIKFIINKNSYKVFHFDIKRKKYIQIN